VLRRRPFLDALSHLKSHWEEALAEEWLLRGQPLLAGGDISDIEGLVRGDMKLADDLAAEQREEALQFYGPALQLQEIAISLLFRVSLYVHEAQRHRSGIIWPDHPDEERAGFLVGCVLTQVTNSLLAVRTLSLMGLDAQARTGARATIELMDVLVGMTWSRAILEDYGAVEDDDEQQLKNWYRNLRPSRLHGRLQQILIEGGWPSDRGRGMRHWWTETYRHLSFFSHANALSQAVMTHPTMGDGGSVPSLLGVPTPAAKLILGRLAMYTSVSLQLFGRGLDERHGWPRAGVPEEALFLHGVQCLGRTTLDCMEDLGLTVQADPSDDEE